MVLTFGKVGVVGEKRAVIGQDIAVVQVFNRAALVAVVVQKGEVILQTGLVFYPKLRVKIQSAQMLVQVVQAVGIIDLLHAYRQGEVCFKDGPRQVVSRFGIQLFARPVQMVHGTV